MSWPDRGGTRGRRSRSRRAAVAIAAGIALVLTMAGASSVWAASPSPSSLPGGDPRSSGQGPGLVGDPLLAIGVVMIIALLALGATLFYVRATGGPRRS